MNMADVICQSLRAERQGSVSGSASSKGFAGSSRPYPGAEYGSHYRPSPLAGEKRRPVDDGRSMASKYARNTQSSQATIKHRQPRVTCNIPSIPEQDYFKPGTIVLADIIEEAFEVGSVMAMANDKSIIRVGDKFVCKKRRLFIILAQYAQTYISLPILSHQGNGTKNKPKPEEYVSLRDHRANGEAPSQSLHDPLTTVEMSGALITPASVAHLAYPVSRSYLIPVIIIGRLKISCTNRLIELFRNYMPVQIDETSSASTVSLSIDAKTSVSQALMKLQLLKYAHDFGEMSWSSAAGLNHSDLSAKGVTAQADREQILSLFLRVKRARLAGPGWIANIKKDSLAKPLV